MGLRTVEGGCAADARLQKPDDYLGGDFDYREFENAGQSLLFVVIELCGPISESARRSRAVGRE